MNRAKQTRRAKKSNHANFSYSFPERAAIVFPFAAGLGCDGLVHLPERMVVCQYGECHASTSEPEESRIQYVRVRVVLDGLFYSVPSDYDAPVR